MEYKESEEKPLIGAAYLEGGAADAMMEPEMMMDDE
jgi:hypothetical protein